MNTEPDHGSNGNGHGTNGNGSSPRLPVLGLNRNHTAALAYAALELPVFPCRPGDKAPLTSHGLLDATTDEQQIRAWWLRWPEANVAVPANRFAIVDVDGADNPWPVIPAQRADLEALAFAIAATPRGGRHYWFMAPPGAGPESGYRSCSSCFAANVDLRCAGGYVVVPPSVVNGKPYRWLKPLPHDGEPLYEPPEWLDALIRQSARGAAPSDEGLFADIPADAPTNGTVNVLPAVAVTGRAIVRDTIPEGVRHNSLVRYGGAMRHHGFGESEILAALREVSARRCMPPVPENELQQIAAWWGRQPIDTSWSAIFEMRWEASGRPLAALAPAAATPVVERARTSSDDPGPVPAELLDIPGFVGDVTNLTLGTAPYPNRALAFSGALALQAHLCARRVTDDTGTRPNLYLLALADSGTGKEWPRKVNMAILAGCGGEAALGDSMVSSAGVEDALAMHPAMLYQTDEIDALLAAINTARDERYKLLMQTLLRCYSSSGSLYSMRRKSGGAERPPIQHPHLTIYGTAIPAFYYRQLSPAMLANGFFARTLVVEAGLRADGRDAKPIVVPDNVAEAARWWHEFHPGGGNLNHQHPRPYVVPRVPAAVRVLAELRSRADVEHRRYQGLEDQGGCSLIARLFEHAAKLALLYACSANRSEPVVTEEAAAWGARLAEHIVRRMLWQVANRETETRDSANLKRVMDLIQRAPGATVGHRELSKRLKLKVREVNELVHTLLDRGDLEEVAVKGRTGPARKAYRATAFDADQSDGESDGE